MTATKTHPLVLGALLLASAACEDSGSRLQPSLNTVDPSTHAPYQRSQPKTTGNPMSDTDAIPDRPGDDDHPSHHQVPEKPDLAGEQGAELRPMPPGQPQAIDEAPQDELNPHTGEPSKDLASPAPTVRRKPAPAIAER